MLPHLLNGVGVERGLVMVGVQWETVRRKSLHYAPTIAWVGSAVPP